MDDLDTYNGGQAIRNRRMKSSWSIDELSRRTSIHADELREYEDNQCGIPERHFRKLAQAFDMNVLELSQECVEVAIPGFSKTRHGRVLKSLVNDIVEELAVERNGHTNGKVPKTPKRKANKPKAIA